MSKPDIDGDGKVVQLEGSQEVIDVVIGLLQSATFEEKRRLIDGNPDLRSEAAVHVLRQIESIHEGRRDGGAAQGTRGLRELLEYARVRGTDAALLREAVFQMIHLSGEADTSLREDLERAGERFPELLRPEADAVLEDLVQREADAAKDDDDEGSSIYEFIRDTLREQRESAEVTPAPESKRFMALLVAMTLIELYEQHGDIEKLDRAIRACRQALAEGPEAGPWLDRLGIALKLRYQISGKRVDIEDALAAHARLHQLGSKHDEDRWRFEVHYAMTLRAHYGATGSESSRAQAIPLLESLISRFENNAHDQITAMTNLASLLAERGGEGDLEAAVAWYRKAHDIEFRVQENADEGDLATVVTADGCVPMLELGIQSQDAALIEEARSWFNRARESVQTWPHRLYALGLNWTRAAINGNQFGDCPQGYWAAVQAVRQLVFRAEQRNSGKQDWLRHFQWAVGSAAMALTRLGRPEEAVVALELGLNLLIVDRQLSRRQPPSGENLPTAQNISIRDVHERLGDRRAAVYLVPAQTGSVMLFVWRGTVSAMPCPTLDGLDEQMLGDDLKNLPRTPGLSQIGNLLELGGYLGALARWRSDVEDGVSDIEITRNWDESLRSTCRWLWDAVVGTLAQQIREQSIGELLLIPVGRLAGVPIHTAFGPLPGEADPSDRMLLDYADVTYVPSVTVMDARAAADVRSRSVVAVADSDSLAYSGLEANRLVQAVGAGNFLDGALDVESLRPFLQRHPIWHFACHSDVDMARAESGYLLLNGQRVDVDDLLAGMQDKPTLVNLAACATATANTTLLTESINLASEFVARGVRCIVASGWPVDDAASCVFMVRYYETLSRIGWNPARAMRETQLWARSATHKDRMDYVRGWKASSIEDAERIEALTLSMENASGYPGAQFKWWAAFFVVGIA